MTPRTTAIIEDRTDIRIALAEHTPDGERYIVQYCSLWTPGPDSKCVGSRIIAAVGPIADRDLFPDGDWPIHDTRAMLDQVDRVDWELTSDDATWLQAEEDAGRLTYPYGAR